MTTHKSGHKPESLYDFTERAMRATVTGELVPPTVYIPVNMRRQFKRVTVDDARVTVSPPTDTENDLRVAQADPVGFLIAVMQGQPIPAFVMHKDDHGYRVETEYRVPDLLLRSEAAHWLADRKEKKRKAGDPEYEAMIERMAPAPRDKGDV